jgi:hypothetical protein
MSNTHERTVGIAAMAAAILLSTFGSMSAGENLEAASPGGSSEHELIGRNRFIIAGFGQNEFDESGNPGVWSHAFAVKTLPNGRGAGTVRVELLIVYPEGPLDIEYTSDVDCVEIDRRTGEAWIGGTIIDTNVPDLLNVYVVDYAQNGGKNGDRHGDFLVEPDSGVTCHDRPSPYSNDPVTRGNIYIFKRPVNQVQGE